MTERTQTFRHGSDDSLGFGTCMKGGNSVSGSALRAPTVQR